MSKVVGKLRFISPNICPDGDMIEYYEQFDTDELYDILFACESNLKMYEYRIKLIKKVLDGRDLRTDDDESECS